MSINGSRRKVSEAGDEQGPYPRERLRKMDEKFCSRLERANRERQGAHADSVHRPPDRALGRTGGTARAFAAFGVPAGGGAAAARCRRVLRPERLPSL